mmetsp:Transcript_634/g.2298  ORF Transcript_634/g.2298 Transcript_634/m.2298 type:complete len:208 (+) Transcript_634:1607-2230(+)
MLQPPLSLRVGSRRIWRGAGPDAGALDRRERQARAPRQAPPAPESHRPPRAHLQPDGDDAQHPRGLHAHARVPAPAPRRQHARKRTPHGYGTLQRAGQQGLCLSAVHARWRSRYQPRYCRYRHHFRLGLEPAERFAGDVSRAPHRAEGHCERVPFRDEQERRRGHSRAREAQDGARPHHHPAHGHLRPDRHRQGQLAGDGEADVQQG